MRKDVLNTNEYIPYYQTYINKAGDLPLIDGLKQSQNQSIAFLESIPEETYGYAYSEGKWTIKEVIQHVIDTERIFAYRALCIGRKDETSFPGYEQDDYAVTSQANLRTKQSLISEYKTVRMSNISLFESFTDEMLKEIGTASNSPVSPRAIAFVLIGHETHHWDVIKARYL